MKELTVLFAVVLLSLVVVFPACGVKDHPRWNFQCDINGDRKIDMHDVSAAARNFGKP